ncbi:hypothetical protein HPP92_019240 [Vanilla planifolia]|uniref:Uncharacterized protein n=1 Tax=Vanilla planifolia TaxID=51239 RepID=A0A835Q783_VANPL|nr:hypothetical protein HPP92_019240 [Vanilla planifolia]
MVSTGIGGASLSSLILHAETNHRPRLLPQNRRSVGFRAKAAKLPAGRCEGRDAQGGAKAKRTLFGFTKTAETWNSRACMIGIIGTFIVELVSHKGILQMIGVEVGKGLNLPL